MTPIAAFRAAIAAGDDADRLHHRILGSAGE